MGYDLGKKCGTLEGMVRLEVTAVEREELGGSKEADQGVQGSIRTVTLINLKD